MTTGRIYVHPAMARERFRQLAMMRDEEVDLTEASLVIALEEYPGLQIEPYLERIHVWTSTVRERLGSSRDVERIVDEVNRLLFDEEGFHGEADDYYDPRNAFLNDVLDRHAGLPIALSIVYIELSRALGIETSGVALPGHFLVKLSGEWGDLLIDPFDEGRVLAHDECQELIDHVFGGAVRLREHHLRSFGNKEILSRLLSHLKSVYVSRRDPERAAASIDRLLILDDRDPFELHDRARLAMELHQYGVAIDYLERYLKASPAADDNRRVRDEIDYLRSWIGAN
ncbi:MAG: tetratricopeptide repeat protein [Acidobacteriota bacterium]